MLAFQDRQPAPGDAALLDDNDSIRLLDSLQDSAVFHLDLTGRVISWNRGAERVFGLTSAGFRAREYTMLLRASDASNRSPGHPLRTALARGRYRIADWRTRTDGTCFWAEIMISPLVDHSQHATGFLAVVKDTTGHRRRVDRMRAALDILQAVMGDHRLEQALQVVVRQARSLLNADGAHVALPAPGTGKLVLAVAAGWNARLLRGANWPARHSVIARVMESGRPTIVDETTQGERSCQLSAGTLHFGPMAAVPVARRRWKIGTLVVYNRTGGPAFRRQDMELLRCFAGHAALARGPMQQGRRGAGGCRSADKGRERRARFLRGAPVRSVWSVMRGLSEASDCCQDRDTREQLAGCTATMEGAPDELRTPAVG